MLTFIKRALIIVVAAPVLIPMGLVAALLVVVMLIAALPEIVIPWVADQFRAKELG